MAVGKINAFRCPIHGMLQSYSRRCVSSAKRLRTCQLTESSDGREFVVTSSSCVSIQGEDGRSIENVDISPFINNLPGGLSTTSFSTKDASGSTSMAAGVIEVCFASVLSYQDSSYLNQALELGADTILFDEDTCATNFLIRDRRMQRLIKADPITPLIFKASITIFHSVV